MLSGLSGWFRTLQARHGSAHAAPIQTWTREQEIDFLKELPDPKWHPNRPTGVLLADQIEKCIDEFRLVEPALISAEFPTERSKNKLRAAGYELSVGAGYYKRGKISRLSDELGQNELIIDPFDAVIIQTYERLNLPHFMIARWDVTVGNAYLGLLWVGAAQVDPGFKGYLCCPIYNLSNKRVVLKYKDPLAVIDFVSTSHPTIESEQYRFNALSRKRLLIDDYGPLNSALTDTQEGLDRIKAEMGDVRSTVTTSNVVILTALGALVTALALFVTKDYPEPLTRLSLDSFVSLIALVIACISLITAMVAGGQKRKSASLLQLLLVFILGAITWYVGQLLILPPAPAIPVHSLIPPRPE